MVAGDEDKWYAGGLCYLCGGIEEVVVCASAYVVAFVLVDVTETEDDACLGHVAGIRLKCHFLGAIFTHVDDVVHDSGEVGGAGAIMVGALVGVTVGEEHSSEPNILSEPKAVSFVVVGEDSQFVVVERGSKRVRLDLTGIDGGAVDLHSGDQAIEIGSARQGDSSGAVLLVRFRNTVGSIDPIERERHLCADW